MRIIGDVPESGSNSAQHEKVDYVVHPNADLEDMGIYDE
jgi:hypothetical protein